MDLVVAILSMIGLPAILGTIIPFLVTRHYNKKDENKSEHNDALKRLGTLEEKYSDLLANHTEDFENFRIEAQEMHQTLENLKSAQQALLRDRIIETYNHYYRDKKHMPIYARESLEHMYQEYKNLNGNGVIEALIERLYDLPTDPLDDEEDSD